MSIKDSLNRLFSFGSGKKQRIEVGAVLPHLRDLTPGQILGQLALAEADRSHLEGLIPPHLATPDYLRALLRDPALNVLTVGWLAHALAAPAALRWAAQSAALAWEQRPQGAPGASAAELQVIERVQALQEPLAAKALRELRQELAQCTSQLPGFWVGQALVWHAQPPFIAPETPGEAIVRLVPHAVEGAVLLAASLAAGQLPSEAADPTPLAPEMAEGAALVLPKAPAMAERASPFDPSAQDFHHALTPFLQLGVNHATL